MSPKEKWEEDAKDQLVAALKEQGRGDWSVLNTDVVVDPATNENFDYQLGHENELIALEIFRLTEVEVEIKRHRQWSLVTNALTKECSKKGIKGYTISTPHTFNVSTGKIERFASRVVDGLQKLIEANPRRDITNKGEYEIKYIEDLPDVSFFAVGPGGAFNASGDAYDFVTRKLPKKNRQLNIVNHERVVLILGWAPLIGKRDMIEAFSQIDFSQYPNIDKVYFVFPNQAKVDLIYDRQVYASFQPNAGPPAQISGLFVSWLGNHLARKNPQAFSLVRQIGDQKNSLGWLPELSRQQLTDTGEDFVDQENSEQLHWIVDRLRYDPDPILENAPDGNPTEHEGIKRGEEIRIITSVRGRFCWLLVRMIAKPRIEDYAKIFEIVRQLATEENLYVRQQAAIPLHELARRRFAKTPSGDNVMSSGLAADIKALALRMVEENKHYPGVLENVARVLDSVRDLDNDTALSVLAKLFSIDDSEAADYISCLAIYFALFRVNHFAELKPFDPATIQALLLDRLVNGAERFRAFSAQRFKEILETNQLPFEVVYPYLQVLVKGKPSRPINHHLYEMATKQVQAHPNEIGTLIETSVAAEMKMIETTGREVWYESQFKTTLSELEKAGEAHKERVARIKSIMEPFKGKIADLYGIF